MSNIPTTNDPLMDHAYDGIQEFDNPLPGWWKWTFVATIVFSVCYAMYYHIGAPGRSIEAQYENELAASMQLLFADIGDLEPNEKTIATYMQKDSWLKVGSAVFKQNCISCHGRNAEGLVGPNLTDDHYKNVSDLEGIARVLKNGAANNAMPAWENRLSTNEIVLVAAYVASLRGTNQPGKGPEGREIPPWPTVEVEEESTDSGEEAEAAS